jgi:DNA-binding XRE family transcriptional regulator
MPTECGSSKSLRGGALLSRVVSQIAAGAGGLTEPAAAVGPCLRALRQQGDLTLADLSSATGISVSTLLRLESGQRRPYLELLLPLARVAGAGPQGERVHVRARPARNP